jgi:hypothetical protein
MMLLPHLLVPGAQMLLLPRDLDRPASPLLTGRVVTEDAVAGNGDLGRADVQTVRLGVRGRMDATSADRRA